MFFCTFWDYSCTLCWILVISVNVGYWYTNESCAVGEKYVKCADFTDLQECLWGCHLVPIENQNLLYTVLMVWYFLVKDTRWVRCGAHAQGHQSVAEDGLVGAGRRGGHRRQQPTQGSAAAWRAIAAGCCRRRDRRAVARDAALSGCARRQDIARRTWWQRQPTANAEQGWL